MNLDGLSLFIINSDITSRSRLREVIKSSVYKATSEFVLSIRDAKEAIERFKDFDVVFISFGFGSDTIAELIKHCNEILGSKCPSFIITIERQLQNTSTSVTSLFLDGAAGFIAEPYSSTELTSLLTAVKNNKEKLDTTDRQKRASRFLFLESANRVDLLAASLQANKDPSVAIKKELKGISEALGQIYTQDAVLYADTMADVFENIAPPAINEKSTRRQRAAKKKSPQHPGTIVQEIMRERNLTLERLTPSIKVDLEEFESLLQCTRPVDDKFSRELSRLFGKTSIEWLKIQKEYDHFMELNEAKQKASES